jgi:LPS export ABC transporter protein LptC
MVKKGLLFSAILIILFSACNTEKSAFENLKPYEGPMVQMTNVNTLFSDSAKVKAQLIAPTRNEFKNGDSEFPDGIVLFFFDTKGDTNSSLKANYAKLVKATGIYSATGNVIIENQKEGKTMNTEELNWNPNTQKVYTEKFVRIKTQTEILTGNGLDASQDFSSYKIRNPEGVFSVNQP